VNAVAVLVAVACDADAHVLSDDPDLVVLYVVVDRSDGVRRSVATPRWGDEAIDERSSSNVTTVVADSANNVHVRTGCLSENQHGRLTGGATIATVELTPSLALLRRDRLDAAHTAIVNFAVITQR
jgi:hypothetical protein